MNLGFLYAFLARKYCKVMIIAKKILQSHCKVIQIYPKNAQSENAGKKF